MPRWDNAKRQYDVAYAIKSLQQLHTVYTFFMARQGPAYGFRFKDWLDYATTASGNTHVPNSSGTLETVSNADQLLGYGDGTTTRFRLRKAYTSGGTTRWRYLTKPVSGTVVVAKDGVNQASGWTVDTTTGEIIFTSAPANATEITAGCEFDVPVRFGAELDSNGFRARHDDFGFGSVESIPLVEIPDGLTISEDPCGGALELCMAENYQLSAAYSKVYVLSPRTAGLSVILPDTTDLPTGGPMFTLMNGSTESLTVKKYDGTTLATLTADTLVELVLTIDGGGNKLWYMI